MSEKAETNARIGRLYYQALNDAAGYPNGMAYWPEMEPRHKYFETATALDFIEMLVKEGLITVNKPMGLGPSPRWNEGECLELLEHFQANQAKELQEFTERLEHLKAKLNAG